MTDEKVEPKKISVEDRLRAEKLQLQLQNVQLQMQVMQQDLQKALKTREELVKEMNKLREHYQEVYGVDLLKVQIHDDGTYNEAPTSPMPRLG